MSHDTASSGRGPKRGPRPAITATVTVLALVAFAWPGLASWLEFSSDAVAQPWRMLTGHLTHHGFSHLLWDVVMFAALAAWIEARDRVRLTVCLVVAAIAIPSAIAVLQPEIDTYRGLSGIDSALFTLALGLLLREAWCERRTAWTVAAGLAMAGFALNLAY